MIQTKVVGRNDDGTGSGGLLPLDRVNSADIIQVESP
jgi:hypothetical protein